MPNLGESAPDHTSRVLPQGSLQVAVLFHFSFDDAGRGLHLIQESFWNVEGVVLLEWACSSSTDHELGEPTKSSSMA